MVLSLTAKLCNRKITITNNSGDYEKTSRPLPQKNPEETSYSGLLSCCLNLGLSTGAAGCRGMGEAASECLSTTSYVFRSALAIVIHVKTPLSLTGHHLIPVSYLRFNLLHLAIA